MLFRSVSQSRYHYKGMAADLDFSGLTPDQARAKIIEWKSQGKLKKLGGMELGVNWVHIDVRDPLTGRVMSEVKETTNVEDDDDGEE